MPKHTGAPSAVRKAAAAWDSQRHDVAYQHHVVVIAVVIAVTIVHVVPIIVGICTVPLIIYKACEQSAENQATTRRSAFGPPAP